MRRRRRSVEIGCLDGEEGGRLFSMPLSVRRISGTDERGGEEIEGEIDTECPLGGGFGGVASGVQFGPGAPLGRPQGGGFGGVASGVQFGPGAPLGRPQGGTLGVAARVLGEAGVPGLAGVPFGAGIPLGRPQGGGFGVGAAGVPFGGGAAGVPYGAADENPRFVIPVKNKQRSVCFEIAAPSDGVILQLVSDADSGITINGELGEAGKSAFQKIGIVYKDLYEIEFNTQGLSLVNKTDHSIQTLSWSPMSIVSDRDFTVDYGTLSKDRVSCWVVPDGGRGAIEGSYSDYVVQTLFQKP
ncbi:UNVERIFIED_CONTAM: hypothetical protein FKN15_074864 [Acipenser sinensis]